MFFFILDQNHADLLTGVSCDGPGHPDNIISLMWPIKAWATSTLSVRPAGTTVLAVGTVLCWFTEVTFVGAPTMGFFVTGMTFLFAKGTKKGWHDEGFRHPHIPSRHHHPCYHPLISRCHSSTPNGHQVRSLTRLSRIRFPSCNE